jgi:2-oxoisovalerate dehydrogenase E1 component
MVAWGQENRDWGGAFGVYRGLTELLGYPRLFNAPVSEAAIVGAGVGYAMCGGRAVVELMYADLMGRAGDELFNQAPKWQALSAGTLTMPLVIRMSVGNAYGSQLSQDWSAMLAHIPGLKVYYPATPADAKGMLNLALGGTDPVVFLESQKLYDMGERFEPDGVGEAYYETPEGEPALRREGSDLTIATLGPSLYTALEAADILADQYGLSAEVIDLRFIAPLTYDRLTSSVHKTGRLLVVSEAVERGSFMHTVASTISQTCFDDLDAPVIVLGARNHVAPAPGQDWDYFPGVSAILEAIDAKIVPLGDFGAAGGYAEAEVLREARAAA